VGRTGRASRHQFVHNHRRRNLTRKETTNEPIDLRSQKGLYKDSRLLGEGREQASLNPYCYQKPLGRSEKV
jgi:hypothetical protein